MVKQFAYINQKTEYRCECGNSSPYYHGDVFLYGSEKDCECGGKQILVDKKK